MQKEQAAKLHFKEEQERESHPLHTNTKTTSQPHNYLSPFQSMKPTTMGGPYSLDHLVFV